MQPFSLLEEEWQVDHHSNDANRHQQDEQYHINNIIRFRRNSEVDGKKVCRGAKNYKRKG